MKEYKGKIHGIYERKQISSSAIVQRFAIDCDGSILFVNAFNNSYLLDDLKVGDQIVITINEKKTIKDNVTYINNYLVTLTRPLSSKEQQEVDRVIAIQNATQERYKLENELDKIELNIYRGLEDDWFKAGKKSLELTKEIKPLLNYFTNQNRDKWDEYTQRIINKLKVQIMEPEKKWNTVN